MRKKILRWAGMIIVSSLTLMAVSNTYATNDIDSAKQEKEELESKLKDTQSALNSLEALKGNTEAYIKKMDEYVGNITDNIYKLEQQAEAKRLEITSKEAEIADMEQQIKEQYEAMKLRIQYMYENGEVSYISMFFESEDMSDFLNKAEYLTEITNYDRDMLGKLEDAEASFKQAKLVLDGQLDDLNGLVNEAQEERKAAEVLIAAKEKELDVTKNDIYTKEQLIKQQEEEIRQQEQLIKELEEIERKRQEEAKKQNQTLVYDGGTFMWPCPDYTVVSSEFGGRIHPITGIYTHHSGLDIAAPMGTKIYAAYDGEVAWSNKSDSAGEWIGIDHGNGLYTIYMHSSKRLVSQGQKVKKGDLIALVGSTGNSTGPHLHFSVRLNGQYVDPRSYIIEPR